MTICRMSVRGGGEDYWQVVDKKKQTEIGMITTEGAKNG